MGSARKKFLLDGQNKSSYYLSYSGLLGESKAKTGGIDTPSLASMQNTPPPNLDTPLRNMTESEAREVARFQWQRQEFRFVNQNAKGWQFPSLNLMKKNADGTISWTGQLLLENVISNVEFVNVSISNAPPLIYGCGWRMLVLACRLAKFVLHEFGGGATIYHLGFAGRGTIDTNRHNRGVALDFVGVSNHLGDIRVERDWWNKPVPDSIGGVQGKWPNSLSFTDSRFRINATSDRAAHEFFLKIYNFAITECTDGSNKTPSSVPSLSLPGPNGHVIHPDYGTDVGDTGRTAHKNHIHMEVSEEFA